MIYTEPLEEVIAGNLCACQHCDGLAMRGVFAELNYTGLTVYVGLCDQHARAHDECRMAGEYPTKKERE